MVILASFCQHLNVSASTRYDSISTGFALVLISLQWISKSISRGWTPVVEETWMASCPAYFAVATIRSLGLSFGAIMAYKPGPATSIKVSSRIHQERERRRSLCLILCCGCAGIVVFLPFDNVLVCLLVPLPMTFPFAHSVCCCVIRVCKETVELRQSSEGCGLGVLPPGENPSLRTSSQSVLSALRIRDPTGVRSLLIRSFSRLVAKARTLLDFN